MEKNERKKETQGVQTRFIVAWVQTGVFLFLLYVTDMYLNLDVFFFEFCYELVLNIWEFA